MINKILYIARKAKGLTESETAKALNIEEDEYKELEFRIKRMTTELAEKLGDLFNVGPEYFMACEFVNPMGLTDVLKKQRDLLNIPEYRQSEGRVHIAIAKMGIEAAIAIQESYVLLREQKELEKENQALRELYEDLKNRRTAKPRKPGRSEVKKK